MKPRTIASRPETSITPSRIRSSIVIGIGWSGPLVLFKFSYRRVGSALTDGLMEHPARQEIAPSGTQIHPTNTRRLYSGRAKEGHARLALLTPESRGCGIFLCHCTFPVRPEIAP